MLGWSLVCCESVFDKIEMWRKLTKCTTGQIFHIEIILIVWYWSFRSVEFRIFLLALLFYGAVMHSQNSNFELSKLSLIINSTCTLKSTVNSIVRGCCFYGVNWKKIQQLNHWNFNLSIFGINTPPLPILSPFLRSRYFLLVFFCCLLFF